MNKKKCFLTRNIWSIIYAFLFAFVFLIFQNSLISWILKLIPEGMFENLIVILLYAAAAVMVFIFLCQSLKLWNDKYLIYYGCALIIYILLKFNLISHSWNFVSMWTIIDYLSPVLFSLGLLLIKVGFKISFFKAKPKTTDGKIDSIKTSNSSENTNKEDNIILTDTPIQTKKGDKFGYYEDAKRLVQTLFQNRHQTDYGVLTVGLEGEWGSGKTTYLNMMQRAAEDNSEMDIRIIRFNAWRNRGYDDLVENFFKALAEGINDLTITALTRHYTQTLVDAKLGWFSALLAFFCHNTKGSEELYQQLGDKIKDLKPLIMVQIDDMDRLSAEEIWDMMKLVKSLADFSNMIIVLAYDPEYVKDAFIKLKLKDKYLEKIINIKYTLPVSNLEVKKNLIKSIILKGSLINSDYSKVIESFLSTIKYQISLRNAKRFANSIFASMQNLLKEEGKISAVDVRDYLLISYLRLYYLPLYTALEDLIISHKDNPLHNIFTIKDDRIIYKEGVTEPRKDEDDTMTTALKKIVQPYNPILIDILNDIFCHNYGEERMRFRNSYASIRYFNSNYSAWRNPNSK